MLDFKSAITLTIIIIICLLFINGCSSIQFVDKPVMPYFSATLLQECKPMTYLKKTDNTLGKIMLITVENANKYHECELLNHAKNVIILKGYKK